MSNRLLTGLLIRWFRSASPRWGRSLSRVFIRLRSFRLHFDTGFEHHEAFMRIPLVVLCALGILNQGCARLLQASYDPSGAVQGLGADTAADLDRILAAHPDADNAGDLRSLRDQAGQDLRTIPRGSRRSNEAAKLDHAAQRDRHVQAVRGPTDRLILQNPRALKKERGSSDRRPDSGEPWAPQIDGTPRRFP